MRKLVGVVLMMGLGGPLAWACPDLRGAYECGTPGHSEPRFVDQFVNSAGATVYQFSDEANGEPDRQVVVDGIPVVAQSSTTEIVQTLYCDPLDFYQSVQITVYPEGEPPQAIELREKMYRDGSQLVMEGYAAGMLQERRVCEATSAESH